MVVPGSFYIYAPTQGVSIAFAVLFATSGILHIWQNNLKYRSWRIGFLLPVSVPNDSAYTTPDQLETSCAWIQHHYMSSMSMKATTVLALAPQRFHS